MARPNRIKYDKNAEGSLGQAIASIVASVDKGEPFILEGDSSPALEALLSKAEINRFRTTEAATVAEATRNDQAASLDSLTRASRAASIAEVGVGKRRPW